MRSADQIEKDMDVARSDLEASLGELKDVVKEKIDVPARTRRAFEHAMDRALEVGETGMVKATGVYYRIEDKVRERPDIAIGVVVGLVAIGGLALVISIRRRSDV